MSIAEAQRNLERAQGRYDDLSTGFDRRTLALAEADEDVEYHRAEVEDVIERPARPLAESSRT